jgi:hypothetical protein
MPAWIPVCRHRVGCARIKKAISEHGAFQHAGARFRTRGVSERLSGVSGRLAFRNGFWRSGMAFGRSGTGFGRAGTQGGPEWVAACPGRPPGVPEWPKPVLGHEASRNTFCRSRTGFGVPRRQSAVQSGGEASQNGIGAGRHGERRASTRSLDPVRAAHSVPQPAPTLTAHVIFIYLYLLHYQHSHDSCMHSTILH